MVESRYLVWDVEEREGRPALCIVLPKATAQQVRVNDLQVATEQGSDNAIFDETLHMSGEQVRLPQTPTPTLTLALALTLILATIPTLALTLTRTAIPTLTLTLTPNLSSRSFCPGSLSSSQRRPTAPHLLTQRTAGSGGRRPKAPDPRHLTQAARPTLRTQGGDGVLGTRDGSKTGAMCWRDEAMIEI